MMALKLLKSHPRSNGNQEGGTNSFYLADVKLHIKIKKQLM